MVKTVVIDDQEYTITDEGNYSSKEELVFELKRGNSRDYVTGMWDDFLGYPIRKVWKIVDNSVNNSYI